MPVRHSAGHLRPRRPAIAKEVAGVEWLVLRLDVHVQPAPEQKQSAESKTGPNRLAENGRHCRFSIADCRLTAKIETRNWKIETRNSTAGLRFSSFEFRFSFPGRSTIGNQQSAITRPVPQILQQAVRTQSL
jgi:hypothetical protein